MFRNAAVALLVLTSLCSAQNPHPSLPVVGADGVLTPSGIAVDSAGNVYIADAVHHRVQRISHGAASTVAGTGVTGFAGDGGPATGAALNSPTAIAIDSDGSLYIADSGNHRVRRVANGIITTIAGSGGSGSDGDHGPATKAAIGRPHGVAVNSAGTLFIAAEGRVRRVADGVISTIAGTGLIGFSGDDGPAVNAAMDPRALAVDTEGNLYIADEAAGRVRRVYKGTVSTVAIGRPLGLAVDGHGVLYFADAADKRIRRVSNGALTVVAGESEPVTATALAVAPDGNLIVADDLQSSVRTLLPAATPVISSVVTAYAGTTLSPNAWVEIRGTGLVPASTPSNGQDWSKAPDFASGRMPTSLNGISVTVNGIPAYIYFYCSSATAPQCPLDQINLLTPLDNTQGTIQVVVNNNGTRSAAYNSTLRSSAPSFFQWAGRYAVATHVNNTGVGPTSLFPGYSTPARPNEVIVLWMTGFGLPGTGLTQGSSTQRGNLPFTPVIQFNGITAAVSFASVISPGLYQINLTVPSSVPSGDVPVTVSYNGVTGPATNYITISGGTAPPAISSFSANPPGINAGQSATLNWNVANASSLSIDNGIGAVTGSSRTVNPTATTTYKLTATNGAGSVSASTTVTVSTTPAPTINSFTATPTTITAGQSTTLSWNVSNAASVSIDNGIGAVAASGSRSVSPGASTIYTLSAGGGGVTRTASVTVSVQSACGITGAAASDTYFISNSSTLSKGSSWTQGFTLSSKTNFQLRVVTDYTAQTAVFAPDQLNAFTNNGSFQAYVLFDNKFGTQSLTLNPGSYYVGIRNTSSATSNQYGLELDYAMNIPGLSYIDAYLNQATTVGANGGKVWQPFTIQCGIRYLMDGNNSGLKTYIIPADQFAGFQNNQGFKFYTDYSSDYDDTAQPGYYEVKLPAGDYYLVFSNDTTVTKAVTYIMERWH